MQQSPCDAFKKKPDGSWTCIKPVTTTNPSGVGVSLSPSVTFKRGILFAGLDMAKWLDEHCA